MNNFFMFNHYFLKKKNKHFNNESISTLVKDFRKEYEKEYSPNIVDDFIIFLKNVIIFFNQIFPKFSNS